MARALRAWATNQGGKNSVRNLRYGPRTRLVRGMYTFCLVAFSLHAVAIVVCLGLSNTLFKPKKIENAEFRVDGLVDR